MITGKNQLICLNLPYTYLAFDVTPEKLPAAIEGLKALDFRGANLTMPLKTAVLPLCDELSRVSRLCLSVNTLVYGDNGLYGTTTDGIGLTDSLSAQGAEYIGRHVTLLGAGGAATAIAAQIAVNGAAGITIFQRRSKTFERAVAFADRVNAETDCRVDVVDLADLDAMKQSLADSSVLINATNVGMGADARSLVPEAFLVPGLFVYDIIYEPAETPLLAAARKKGLSASNGKDMLLYQGAAAFYQWTYRDMPIDLVKERVFNRV